MPGLFDDLIPAQKQQQPQGQGGLFDDLIPAQPAAPSPQYTATASDLSGITQNMDKVPVPEAPSTATYLLQRGDRGIADALGSPIDLTAAALNVLASGIDKTAGLFGGSMTKRVTNPVGGSDWIANRAAEANKALTGNDVIADEDVSSPVRMFGAAARGAGAAAVPAFGLAAAPTQAAVEGGRGFLSKLAAPYIDSPGATIARDMSAGAGAGIGAQGYDEYAPDTLKDSVAGPFAKALLSLMGGVTGAGVESLVEGTGKGLTNFGRNMVRGKGDPNAPINPSTGEPFTRSEMDVGARVAQEMPSNRPQAIANIEDNANDFAQFANPTQTPTVGMLADDPGMALQENILRTKDAKRFAERDNARRSLASSKVDQSAPSGAESRNFTNEATRQYDDALGGARQGVEDATAAQAAAKQQLAGQNAELEAARANQPRASEALASEFDAARRAARQEKNALYDAVPDTTQIDAKPLAAALDAADKRMSNMERMSGGAYSDIAGRVRQLVDSGKPVTYGDVKALRAQISEARRNAVSASGNSVAGSGADVERLDFLGDVVNNMADQVNPDAAKHYREQYAPRFKQGKAGEYGAAMDRAVHTGGESSATRPSEFGGKFLGAPEDAASLRRALTPEETETPKLPGPVGEKGSGMFPQSEQNVKDWMMGDLAKSGVLTDNAEIRYDRFKRWTDKNRATIDQFPELRNYVDKELSNAQRGGALSRQLAQDVADARKNLGATEQDLRRSSLQFAIGSSPENAVNGIMNSGDPEKRMSEMIGRLNGNKDATDGLKAAVRDWIKEKAGVTSKIVGDPDATRLSRANLEKLFQKHENTLAKIYSPDEMNALRQAHKLMGAEAKLDVRTTAGSNTVDKVFAAQNRDAAQKTRLLEAALKAKYGVLKGGGVFRTVTLFLQSLPDGKKALDDLLFEMQFNPDLAKHLLTRPVKDVGTPSWNAKLNRIMAVATGARESVKGREDDKK